ncbi:MAG: tRNA (adenosine(37)-N6)-threonylcarbamoyltransferase complex ATPase subunit type 1 TsaE, partial [Patescibacteria group bacterium]
PLKKRNFKTFIHIDCYRLKDAKELEALGWSDLATNPKNIILIEWADRVKTILPATRIITISS